MTEHPTEHPQLRTALRSLADAGPAPDEDAAWAAITAGAAAEAARRRRARRGAAGLAVAAAALVAVMVVGRATDTPDDRVDVGPAGEGQPSDRLGPLDDPLEGDGELEGPIYSDPQVVQPTPTGRAPGGEDLAPLGPVTALPADPVALLDDGGRTLVIVDASTGEVAARPVRAPEDSRLIHPQVTAGGDVVAGIVRDGSIEVVLARWDGTGATRALPGWDDASTWQVNEARLSDAGTQVALSILGHPRGEGDLVGGLAIVDLPSGDVRGWADPDVGAYAAPAELSFSPDGERLAFLMVHDGDGTDCCEAYVMDLSRIDSEPFDILARVGSSSQYRDLTYTAGYNVLVLAPTAEPTMGYEGPWTLLYPDGDLPDDPLATFDEPVLDVYATPHSLIVQTESGHRRFDQRARGTTPETAWVDVDYGGRARIVTGG